MRITRFHLGCGSGIWTSRPPGYEDIFEVQINKETTRSLWPEIGIWRQFGDEWFGNQFLKISHRRSALRWCVTPRNGKFPKCGWSDGWKNGEKEPKSKKRFGQFSPFSRFSGEKCALKSWKKGLIDLWTSRVEWNPEIRCLQQERGQGNGRWNNSLEAVKVLIGD